MVMRNLLEKSCLRAFYGGHEARDDVSNVAQFRNVFIYYDLFSCKVEAYYRYVKISIYRLFINCITKRIFDTLLADTMPKGQAPSIDDDKFRT